MAETIALIDYGAGNLHSVHNAVRAVGAKVDVTADPKLVAKADRIILPGVGAFAACANALRAIDGMVDALEQRVLNDAVPFLGICVGMQLLATRGIEFGSHDGLDWIGGEVRAIEPSDSVKVPHMGWNDVIPTEGNTGLLIRGEAYFLHGYHFVADDPAHVAAHSDHGGPLEAAVHRDNIIGVQFHPEKSQKYGLNFLRGFLQWMP
ncbi:MAG: imidazole glycerol phosphate synthase subunit HisH [Pseudomonadota bacterium]